MPNVIIGANFGSEKLRGLEYTGGQIVGSPIEKTLTTVLRCRTACDICTTKTQIKITTLIMICTNQISF